jgi:hypothetical protein
MPITQVRDALHYYLKPENSNIANLGVVYKALPKVADESQIFTSTFPGLQVGAMIYMFITGQREKRVALGGQHNGVKFRQYDLGLLIVMKSDTPGTGEGQDAYDTLIDDLTAWIQADRNAWTEAASLGGQGPYVGTGIIFSWGEGAIIGGGEDIVIDHVIPRTIDGGVTLFQSVAHITVIESMAV